MCGAEPTAHPLGGSMSTRCSRSDHSWDDRRCTAWPHFTCKLRRVGGLVGGDVARALHSVRDMRCSRLPAMVPCSNMPYSDMDVRTSLGCSNMCRVAAWYMSRSHWFILWGSGPSTAVEPLVPLDERYHVMCMSCVFTLSSVSAVLGVGRSLASPRSLRPRGGSQRMSGPRLKPHRHLPLYYVVYISRAF